MSARTHDSARVPRDPEWRRWNGRIRTLAKQHRLDDDARRDLQRRVTGKESCADMSVAELRRVVSAISRRAVDGPADGARKDGRAGGARKDGPASARELDAKLIALWISGWHLGVVRDRTDAGLCAWLRRRFGIEVPRWPDFPAKAKAVEGLKAWLAREAAVDWRSYVELGRNGRAREVERPQARVLEAQWRILAQAGVVDIDSLAALGAYACRHAGIGRADSHLALDREQTKALMQHFGAEIRRAQIALVPDPAPHGPDKPHMGRKAIPA